MEQHQDLVLVDTFCQCYEVEARFIYSLHESGLLQLVPQQEQSYISYDDLPKLVSYTQLHYQLDINVEGIEVIEVMLQQMEEMKQQIIELEQYRKLYESGFQEDFS